MLPFVLLDSLEHTLCGAGSSSSSLGALEHVSRTAAAIAVTAAWQGFAIAAVLAVALRFLPRLAAAQRFALWSAAFAAVVGLPVLPSISSGLVPAFSSPAASPAIHPWFTLDARWGMGIGALWGLAALWRFSALAGHSFRLRRMWRAARPVDLPASLAPALSGLSGRRFEVCTVPALDRPSVIGFLRPRILVPDWLFPRLTAGELEQIILHEFEHLRRRDDWTNLLQKIGLVLFPLNPALCFIEARLAEEREMACDEAVVRITRAPRAYAACLASLAEQGQERRAEALSLGAWQRRSELVRRVQSILRGRRGLGTVSGRMLVGVIASSVLVVTLELAHCPQLIAFVPLPASPIHAFAGAAQLGDAVYPAAPHRGQEPAHYFALPAKAVIAPSVANVPRLRGIDAQPTAAGELRAASPATPTVPASPFPRRTKAHSEPAAAQPQFVVFTAWEQVDATAGPDDRIADYDTTGPSGNPGGVKDGAGNDAATSIPSTSRVTVTRLVFRVFPAGSKTAPQRGAKTGISLPATIPFGDGWLVLQL